MRKLLHIAVASILYSCANEGNTTIPLTRSASCDESCDTIDTVEVVEESRTDYYDPVLEKWVCVHEGTLEEIIESHDFGPDSIESDYFGPDSTYKWSDMWIFLNMKK